jgi:hypothetical protein
MGRKLAYLISVVLVLSLIRTSLGQPVDPNLVGWWKFEEASGTLYDQSDYHNDGTSSNGVLYQQAGREGYCLGFDGINDLVVVGTTARPTDTFSFGGWFKTSVTHEIEGESTSGTGGTANQRYAFDPQHGGDLNAGAGLSIGTNGVAVYEHGSNYMPATAVYATALGSDWNHIMVVYNNKRPTIYLNGRAVRTGLSGPRAIVYAPIQFGGMAYGYFAGLMDEVRIYSRALSAAEVKELAFWPEAHHPNPPDGAIGITQPLLQWKAGDTAAQHDVYFGTNPTPGQAEFKVRQAVNYTVYYDSAPLTPGTTYYWRIDEVEADGTTIHTGDVWSFFVTPLKPWDPNPADEAVDVLPDASLAWKPGQGAIMYHVYFGESFDDVDNGTTDTDKGIITATSHATAGLRAETAYYWRIDQFNGTTWQKGDVWSYTTIAAGTGRIIRQWWTGIGGTAIGDLTGNANYPNNPTGWEFVDIFEGPVGWADNYGSRLRGWLFPPATGNYTFWIATDDAGQLWLSTDADPANKVLIASVSGWVGSRDFDNNSGQGGTNQKSAAISLQAGKVYYIEAMMKEGGGGDNIAVAWQGGPITTRQVITADYVGPTGSLPLKAYGPTPANGATDVVQTVTLSWSAGEKAAQHDVFFGTDRTAVANATTATAGIYRGRQALAATTYVPTESPLAWDTTYYWRIDEINTADPEGPWKGNVWSFTTANYILVEDFERYNDLCDRIFYTWTDGWGYSADPTCAVTAYGGNGTGSTVGNLNAPFAEQGIVHGGGQSMPFEYDNSGAAGKARYSEAQRQWTSPQDWSQNNVKALALWFHGVPANAPETLYVAVEDSGGQVKVANHPDPEAIQAGAWQEWNIDLTQFAGVNLKAVKKLYIGLGNRASPKAGGTGKLYIDDIRVYPARCVPSLAKPALDLSGNCIVDYADVEIIADRWLDSSFVITPVNPGTAGLIAHYPLNGNANDVAGGHSGTLNGNPQWVTGHLDGALKFGGSGDYVQVAYSPDLALNEFTMSAWVKVAADPGVFGILGTRSGGEYTFDLKVMGNYVHGDIGTGTAWINTAIDIGSGDTGTTRQGGDLVVYRWYMVAYVIDNANQEVRLYLDGDLKRTIGITGTPLLMQSGETMRIGDTGYSEWMNGLIDEVRIYNRALPSAEIAWLAGLTSPFSIPADLNSDNVINFKDFAVLADSWLDEVLWP